MAIRVALFHQTKYTYDRAISHGPHTIRLRPAPHNRTPLNRYSLKVEPAQHFLNWVQDPHGNYIANVVFPEKVKELCITVDIIADLESYNPFDFFLQPAFEQYPFKYTADQNKELLPYLETLDEEQPLFEALLKTVDLSKRNTVDFLVDLNQIVHKSCDYLIRLEPGVQTPEETLAKHAGSCRDSAWLMVQMLRRLGIAARFVSGYLIQLKADQEAVDGPSGAPEDFTDLHAWCECYVPGGGWIGLDPTSGLFAAEGHIPLAATPFPSSAAPIEGGTEKAEVEFEFAMRVDRVIDRPRVTKPLTEEAWNDILALGNVVDEHLMKKDVRLTMGGEPTFVSSEYPDDPEWNHAALGPTKLPLADKLFRRLSVLWGQGGLPFHGQGKWYPGEELPRWALCNYMRKDGVPLWNDLNLIAKSDVDYGHTEADGKRFMDALIVELKLGTHGLMSAHEDSWYYLWRERQLPSNVDPFDSRLSDPAERARLAKVFRQGLDATVGWVLPLAYSNGWLSGSWFLREERCYLIPGDSPLGYRLPLDSIPWVHKKDLESSEPLDPSIPRQPLPIIGKNYFADRRNPSAQDRRQETVIRTQFLPNDRKATKTKKRYFPQSSSGQTLASADVRPENWESAKGIVRTALSVEARDGRLRVFLPPFSILENFVELISALERVAKKLSLPIQIEGYTPPSDPRLKDFKITPDPGVIEVNVLPVKTWPELVEQTEVLYEECRQLKLIAEKFEIDGAHIGSGGGAHLTMGGETPLDSPFLRRPDVLRSLITFWLNHPSLSFLFAGRFIGPTSQAPRIDEARGESVRELELALKQLPVEGDYTPPWLVDRIMRNILIDVTGNTHRAEFCIDKLYSPDSSTGRLGILEMRAFEMPPHGRMAALQQLLLRALLSTFWEKPYIQAPINWGNLLHDKFMMSSFQKLDFEQVLSELRNRGYHFDSHWFDAHFEFRFPYYGSIVQDGIRLELRGALEPWHVLGEESTSGGQARYVDSSVEKLEVILTGLSPGRHTVCCNGVEMNLHQTGRADERVGALRYRAWQPPSCLHPTIPIHGPLHFDIYDNFNQRAIAGCTYHIVHQGGRSNETRPVNAVAAESRRLARFEQRGHMLGNYLPIRSAPDSERPMTTDLLRILR